MWAAGVLTSLFTHEQTLFLIPLIRKSLGWGSLWRTVKNVCLLLLSFLWPNAKLDIASGKNYRRSWSEGTLYQDREVDVQDWLLTVVAKVCSCLLKASDVRKWNAGAQLWFSFISLGPHPQGWCCRYSGWAFSPRLTFWKFSHRCA